jgi:hypothetical protein
MQNTTTLAVEFECSTRELRKFLRSNDSGIAPVGKGSRYALPSSKREVASLKKRYDAWELAKAPQADDAPEEIETA